MFGQDIEYVKFFYIVTVELKLFKYYSYREFDMSSFSIFDRFIYSEKIIFFFSKIEKNVILRPVHPYPYTYRP